MVNDDAPSSVGFAWPRGISKTESRRREKNALLLKRARDAARRRSAELIHDSRPNPKKRMHAGRFRSLPILEPSQGVNTTAFTTYSRDYFPPRGKRLSVQLRRVQLLLAPLYGVYTSRPIFRPLYATLHSDAALPCATKSRTISTRTPNRLVNHRTSQRTRSFPSTVDPLPANFKVTSGAIFCRIREIASRLGTEEEGKKCLIITRGTRSPRSRQWRRTKVLPRRAKLASLRKLFVATSERARACARAHQRPEPLTLTTGSLKSKNH